MAMKTEGRRSQRVPIGPFVVGLSDQDHTVQGNVGVGGVGFEIEASVPVRPGDGLLVHLSLEEEGDEPLCLGAIVRHTHALADQARKYVGAKFVDMDALVENPLFRYVEEAALIKTVHLEEPVRVTPSQPL